MWLASFSSDEGIQITVDYLKFNRSAAFREHCLTVLPKIIFAVSVDSLPTVIYNYTVLVSLLSKFTCFFF